MPHPIDALISDCDGVLVDSEVIAERVMYEALSAYAPLEELQRLLEGTFGLTSRDILDRVEKHFGLRIPDSFNREVRQLGDAASSTSRDGACRPAQPASSRNGRVRSQRRIGFPRGGCARAPTSGAPVRTKALS